MLIKTNYHILDNKYDFMNQGVWYSLMRGIVFETGIDTLYMPLNTENFNVKNCSKTTYLGVIYLLMVSSWCLMQKNVHDKEIPLNKGQKR